jgi:CheY-like chemotaxis protein
VDAISVCSAVRAYPVIYDTRVIILTILAPVSEIDRALMAVADDYVSSHSSQLSWTGASCKHLTQKRPFSKPIRAPPHMGPMPV